MAERQSMKSYLKVQEYVSGERERIRSTRREEEDKYSVKLVVRKTSDPEMKKLKKHLRKTSYKIKDLIQEFTLGLNAFGGPDDSTAAIETMPDKEISPSGSKQEVEPEEKEEVKVDSEMPKPSSNWMSIEEKLAIKRFGITLDNEKIFRFVKRLIQKPGNPVVNINDAFSFKSCLKRGQYCTVNKYYDNINKREVVIKCISVIKIPTEHLNKFTSREIDSCMKVDHPNIIRCFQAIHSYTKIYLVMEVAEKGSLTKYVRERGKLDSVVYKKFFTQIVDAIMYCMENGILHRKICTDNILVTKYDDVKLCDFSYSRGMELNKQLYDTFCGMLAFTAPEILQGQPYNPYLTEAWSIGVVVYCMVYGALPFDPSSYSTLINQVKKQLEFKRYPDTQYPCIYLMHNMIAPIHRRFTINMVANDPWLKEERKPTLVQSEQWPLLAVEPWEEIKLKIESLKEDIDEYIMESIRDYTPDYYFKKLKKMQIKKRMQEHIPDRMEWLYKFYDTDNKGELQ